MQQEIHGKSLHLLRFSLYTLSGAEKKKALKTQQGVCRHVSKHENSGTRPFAPEKEQSKTKSPLYKE
jgi:hypothetical protein